MGYDEDRSPESAPRPALIMAACAITISSLHYYARRSIQAMQAITNA